MSRFSKGDGSKELPEISTASLPDIIFILLFFFMVITVIRENTLLVEIKTPEASELTEIQDKEALSYVYVGTPYSQYREVYGTAPRVQLNDQIVTMDKIVPWIEKERSEKRPAVQNLFTVAFKVDEETSMGIVTDVKQELREANALRVMYSVRPSGGEE